MTVDYSQILLPYGGSFADRLSLYRVAPCSAALDALPVDDVPEQPTAAVNPVCTTLLALPSWSDTARQLLHRAAYAQRDRRQCGCAATRLDPACPGPVGRSAQKHLVLSSLLNDKSLLVANEVVKNRAEVLAMNLSKWGVSNAVVTNQEPKKLAEAGAMFDVLVVDAPCSGSGLFRKQPEAVEEWSLQAVQACSVRQKNILADLLPTLKEGGILVYSTCSYSVEENEAVVSSLINSGEMELVQFDIPAAWGLVDSGKGFRFYPHLTKSEEFFVPCCKKPVMMNHRIGPAKPRVIYWPPRRSKLFGKIGSRKKCPL